MVYPCLAEHYFIAIVFETHLHNRPVSIEVRDYSKANGNNCFRSVTEEFSNCNPPRLNVNVYTIYKFSY